MSPEAHAGHRLFSVAVQGVFRWRWAVEHTVQGWHAVWAVVLRYFPLSHGTQVTSEMSFTALQPAVCSVPIPQVLHRRQTLSE